MHSRMVKQPKPALLTKYEQKDNKYSEALAVEGDKLIAPLQGTGFGFDEQLSQERWRELT